MPKDDSYTGTSATKDEIAAALRIWGAGGFSQEKQNALLFLDALPLSYLVQVIPSLWRSEYTTAMTLSNVQYGIVATCYRRPSWEFTPLLIEALLSHATSDKHRVLLAHLLPLWCAETKSPLTYEQRAILLEELKRFVYRNVGFLRRTFSPENRLLDSEADFCVAILQTVRHEAMRTGVLKLGKDSRRVLESLPYGRKNDDHNCTLVLEVAQNILQEAAY